MRLTHRSVLAATAVSLLATLTTVSSASATYEPGEPALAWGQQWGASGEEVYGQVQVVGDTVWVSGYQNTTGALEPVIARYDRDGRLLDRTVTQPGGAFNDSGTTFDTGDFGVVTATSVGSVTELVRSTAAGEETWRVRLDETQRSVTAVAVEGDTVIVVATTGGQFGSWRVESYDLGDGHALASRLIAGYGTPGSVVTVDGTIVVGGLTMGEMVPGGQVGGDYDSVLMALDLTDLSTVWERQFGTRGNDWISELAVRGDTIYWAGTLGNHDDNPYGAMIGGLGAWSADGRELWRERLQGSAPVRALAATAEGLVIAGEAEPGQLGAEVVGHGHADAFLQGRSFDGETLWTEVYGTRDHEGFGGLATDGADRIYATGYTGGRMFGDGDVRPWDAVLAAFDVPHLQRPDLSIRAGARVVGDNRYGAQSAPVRVAVRRGDERTLTVRVEDDGLLGDRQVLRSCSSTSRGLDLTLRDGRRDVSRSAAAGTYRTRRLAPGGAQRLELEVDAVRARPGTYTCSFVSRSSSRRHEADRLTLRIVVAPRRR